MLALPLTVPLLLVQLLVIEVYDVLRNMACAMRDFIEYTGVNGVCFILCCCMVLLRMYLNFFKN